MSKSEYLEFLTNPARCAKIATVREDGSPHVVPIWFILDGEDLIFTAWHTSAKVRDILRDGRVAICVDDDAPPFHYVLLEGTAEIMDTSVQGSSEWAAKIGGRYMGADRAAEFGKRNGVDGEWVFRMTPDKVIAYKNMTD